MLFDLSFYEVKVCGLLLGCRLVGTLLNNHQCDDCCMSFIDADASVGEVSRTQVLYSFLILIHKRVLQFFVSRSNTHCTKKPKRRC